MDKEERKLSQIAKAQVSQAILVNLKPILDEQKTKLLKSLMARFREGSCDLVEMSSFVAQICALEDLENALTSNIVRAERVSHEREHR